MTLREVVFGAVAAAGAGVGVHVAHVATAPPATAQQERVKLKAQTAGPLGIELRRRAVSWTPEQCQADLKKGGLGCPESK
jgi:hypothetical protein